MIGPAFEAVLEGARAGEEWAFAVLYRDLNPRLLRYFSAQAPTIAEDLASETWLAAVGRLSTFRGEEAALRAWLFTIGRRRLVQHWRESGRRPTRPVDPATLGNTVAPEDTEAEALAATSAQAAARAIAQALTPDQAEVVLLRVLAGLDVAQVAAVLGKRPGTVRVLQHKALRRLARSSSLEALTR
ncbi:MAG TPA: sigma-70 family RNA polymerase sigma factor [Acidimicrobiales bacterium]|nr:sigma-70 family RNA polymerase sigma factor [Acidimicrobiales bacterium]